MAKPQNVRERNRTQVGFIAVAMLTAGLLAGCERSQKLVEIDTPGGGVVVKKTTTTMPTGIDLKPSSKTKIEVETTKPRD